MSKGAVEQSSKDDAKGCGLVKKAYAAVCCFAYSTLLMPQMAWAIDLGAQGNSLLAGIKDLFSTLVIFGGGAILVWGAVKIGTALKDHNGPGISDGTWQVIGGLVICGAGIMFRNLTL